MWKPGITVIRGMRCGLRVGTKILSHHICLLGAMNPFFPYTSADGGGLTGLKKSRSLSSPDTCSASLTHWIGSQFFRFLGLFMWLESAELRSPLTKPKLPPSKPLSNPDYPDNLVRS